jgi:hypothetical protein
VDLQVTRGGQPFATRSWRERIARAGV